MSEIHGWIPVVGEDEDAVRQGKAFWKGEPVEVVLYVESSQITVYDLL